MPTLQKPSIPTQPAFSSAITSHGPIGHAVLSCQFRIPEPQIEAARFRPRVQQARIDDRLKAGDSNFVRWPNLDQRVQRAPRVVRHQDLHPPLRQVLYRLVLRASFTVLTLRGTPSFFVSTPPK